MTTGRSGILIKMCKNTETRGSMEENQKKNVKALYSFEAAGKLLGVDPERLKRAVLLGQVAVVEIGARKMISHAELSRLSGGVIQ